MKSLDPSHLTVLANFNTLQRAQQCVEEIKRYIEIILQDLAGELPENSDPPFRFVYDKKYGYIQANAFPMNCGGTDLPLICIGIESLDLENLLGAEGWNGCRTFVYSMLLNDPVRVTAYAALAGHLRSLKPPLGYVPAPPNPADCGYLFVKKLDGIPAAAFGKREDFKEHVSGPLIELSNWLRAHREIIASFAATPTNISANDIPSAA